MFNVKDFGAVGNGENKDTAAIQTAIDECSEQKGGTVMVPSREYLCGTIWLKSNVNLYLEAGGVIKGSADKSDYNADDAFIQNNIFSRENVSDAHWIIALEVENVSISGFGSIDGSGNSFLKDEVIKGRTSNYHPLKDRRPAQMIYFCECKNVLVENISLFDSPYWNLFLHGCEDVRIKSLRIHSDWMGHNGDGIDIDSCANVSVSDCIIDTNDDSITLRGFSKRLKINK